MTTLRLSLGERGYDINIGKGLLCEAHKYFNLDRRVLIVTDDGVPSEYARTVCDRAREGHIYTVKSGEGSKSLECYGEILKELVRLGFRRGDAVVAVGGGVVGDLAGFVAASYMRGIDFYNVPTTTLSQLDSSIGGKVAINLDGVKNIVGAFYQPCGVLIDTDTLKTLDARQYASGLCEAIKMSMTSNAALFSYFETQEINGENIEYVIAEALKIKRAVVEEDEREGGLRKILNLGHTYGHAIESLTGMREYYHGECVALGMIPMCSPEVRERLIPVLKKFGLPTEYTADLDRVEEIMSHDKKASTDGVDVILVEKIGEYKIERMSVKELVKRIQK